MHPTDLRLSDSFSSHLEQQLMRYLPPDQVGRVCVGVQQLMMDLPLDQLGWVCVWGSAAHQVSAPWPGGPGEGGGEGGEERGQDSSTYYNCWVTCGKKTHSVN